ncbi:hypothetical protein ACF0H5_002673 [Mactra antiquata]
MLGEHGYNLYEWKQHLKHHINDNYNTANRMKTIETLSNTVSSRDFINCTEKRVKLSKHNLPITGLSSFPGSGNTWTRHLIQQMTGLATSSEYCDRSLLNNGFPYECSTDRSHMIVVKTHETKHYHSFQKLVLLIRNPYDALLSMFHITEAGHTGKPDIEKLKQRCDKLFDQLVTWFISLIGNTINEFRGPVYVIQYDELKRNMKEELKKLAVFLDVEVTPRDIDCTAKLQEGNFHRKANFTEHLDILQNVYSKEQLLTLRQVARFSEKLIQRAYGLSLNIGGQVEELLF